MSYCIKVTNLPHDFEEKDVVEMFDDIGPIKRLYIECAQDSMHKKCLFGRDQFSGNKKNKQTNNKNLYSEYIHQFATVLLFFLFPMFLLNQISNVFCVRTIRKMSQHELMEYFASYGEILNIRISQMPVVVAEEKKRESKK
ncbi:hypothetical protein RFI_35807 [Reticulomyxa filosa]|uniref:RRM domain-containing protein n=1 Tax=Reticulomyxa filosa TaxID=46433 RepID=X6LI42_RETFI|nr:hypothetical protein RFI_35807 [Reticulomyxa filosa]|eukprot:ETO01633.1 hypothetical protein RFI_35807 [Reticulomyxa filosa]